MNQAARSFLHRMRHPRRIWLVLAVTAGLAQVVVGYLSLHPHPFESPQAHAARLATAHHITVGFEHPSTFFVPPYRPQDANIAGMTMRGADPAKVSPALDGVEEALDVYPPGFVSHLVGAIFIAGDLRVGSEQAGGSTGPNWFILAAPDSSSDASVRLNALEGVHHELSSFVLNKANAATKWAAFAPGGWSFTTKNETALAHAVDEAPSPETGFLSSYATTTAENDFNTFAERIFTEPKALRQLACKHDLIRRKLLFVLHTYTRLDARMAAVFQRLGLNETNLCSGS